MWSQPLQPKLQTNLRKSIWELLSAREKKSMFFCRPIDDNLTGQLGLLSNLNKPQQKVISWKSPLLFQQIASSVHVVHYATLSLINFYWYSFDKELVASAENQHSMTCFVFCITRQQSFPSVFISRNKNIRIEYPQGLHEQDSNCFSCHLFITKGKCHLTPGGGSVSL